MNSSNSGSFLKSLFSPSGWKAAAVGALGAFAGFIGSSVILGPFFDTGLASRPGLFELLLSQALMFGIEGAALSAAILAWDNHASLRGRWHRDLWPGVLLFFVVAFLSGGAGQLLYSNIGLTRGFPWLLAGAGIGAAIGLLRRDKAQAMRGALGGAIGGLLGGLVVDGFLALSYSDSAFAIGSMVGGILTGAMIALFMRAVQQAMQGAWLMGISSGAYEGKEYPLNTSRITVGQTELNDIALYRDRAVPARAGALVFEDGGWNWHSDSPDITILLNGRMTNNAPLSPGAQLQIGDTKFTFQSRSLRADANQTATYSVAAQAGSTPTVAGWQLQNAVAPIQLAASGNWTIGRASESDFVIGDGTVSSRHAKIEAAPGVLLVTDIGSSNGTFLNGVRLTPQVPTALRSGDRLRLGQSEFVIAAL